MRELAAKNLTHKVPAFIRRLLMLSRRTKIDSEGIPYIYGLSEGNSIFVWCEKCQDIHIHGKGGQMPGEFGHRVEHCTARDRWENGYFIAYVEV